jgi:hypothetical protein
MDKNFSWVIKNWQLYVKRNVDIEKIESELKKKDWLDKDGNIDIFNTKSDIVYNYEDKKQITEHINIVFFSYWKKYFKISEMKKNIEVILK